MIAVAADGVGGAVAAALAVEIGQGLARLAAIQWRRSAQPGPQGWRETVSDDRSHPPPSHTTTPRHWRIEPHFSQQCQCGDALGDRGNIFGIEIADTCCVPVLMIAGNHEFYRDREVDAHTWESTIDDLRRAADHIDAIKPGHVTFLEDQVAVYEGVRFVGTTLWTDMKLFGDDPF